MTSVYLKLWYIFPFKQVSFFAPGYNPAVFLPKAPRPLPESTLSLLHHELWAFSLTPWIGDCWSVRHGGPLIFCCIWPPLCTLTPWQHTMLTWRGPVPHGPAGIRPEAVSPSAYEGWLSHSARGPCSVPVFCRWVNFGKSKLPEKSSCTADFPMRQHQVL